MFASPHITKLVEAEGVESDSDSSERELSDLWIDCKLGFSLV